MIWSPEPPQEGGETLAQIAQEVVGSPSLQIFPDQVEWGSEQPVLGESVPACGRGLELNDLSGPFQPKPFHGSVSGVSASLVPARRTDHY